MFYGRRIRSMPYYQCCRTFSIKPFSTNIALSEEGNSDINGKNDEINETITERQKEKIFTSAKGYIYDVRKNAY